MVRQMNPTLRDWFDIRSRQFIASSQLRNEVRLPAGIRLVCSRNAINSFSGVVQSVGNSRNKKPSEENIQARNRTNSNITEVYEQMHFSKQNRVQHQQTERNAEDQNEEVKRFPEAIVKGDVGAFCRQAFALFAAERNIFVSWCRAGGQWRKHKTVSVKTAMKPK